MQYGQVSGVISCCFVTCQYVSSRTMKVRRAKKSENRNQLAREVARRDATIADLKTQLDKVLAMVNAQA